MPRFRRLILSLLLACACAAAAAANPISVHILDLQTGKPTAGVTVTLEQQQGDSWRMLASAVTNADGRIPELYPAGQALAQGDYRIVFQTGAHYARLKQDTFFPEIPVQFHVERTDQHYHIPLLLSPYGFSTYRGS
ncbi:hydroxyisourate hydrolase [Oxalobacteraceae bacterium A2-2]